MTSHETHPNILLVDDDVFLLKTAELLLKSSYRIFTASSVSQGKAVLQNNFVDVLVCDLNFEGHDQDGLSMMDWMSENFPDIPVIILSGDANTQRVVAAMRRAPVHFVPKAGDYEKDLRIAIEAGIVLRQKAISLKSTRYQFKTKSPLVEKLLVDIDQIARSGTTASILITGESGTGKEVLARHIASMINKPMTTANMASIGKDLAESELFGHIKGAYTGALQDKIGLIEQAHQGLFFLDELGDCTLSVQAKLLRVLQEGEIRRLGDNRTKTVSVQFIAATNKNLPALIASEQFRLDLYQRLNTFAFEIPPLRMRPEDIPFYLTLFLTERQDKVPFSIQASGLDALLSYPWPGNVRELKNFAERVCVLSHRRVIDYELVQRYLGNPSFETRTDKNSSTNDGRLQILKALEVSQGNRTHAAALLGIDPSTLYRQIKKFGITEAVAATQGRPQKTLKTLSSEANSN